MLKRMDIYVAVGYFVSSWPVNCLSQFIGLSPLALTSELLILFLQFSSAGPVAKFVEEE